MFISPVSSEQVKKETAFPGRRRFEDGGRWSWGPPAAGDLNQTATTKSSANLGAAPILLIRVSCLQLHDQAAPARPHQLQREAGSLRHMVATGVGMIQVWTSLARLRLISDASPNDVASKTRPFFPPSFYLLRAESLQRAHGFPFGKQSRPARPEERNGEAVTLPERQNVLGMFLAVGKYLQEPKKRSAFFSGTFFWPAFIPSPTQQVSTSWSLWWIKKQGTHTSKMTIHPQFYYYKSIGEMMYHPRFQIMGTVYSK